MLLELPSWQLAVLRQSSLHLSSVHTLTHRRTHAGRAYRWSQMLCVTAGSETLPPCVQVSSSPMETWGWGPSSAQQFSTSYASLVCVESSPDRCVSQSEGLAAAAAASSLFIDCRAAHVLTCPPPSEEKQKLLKLRTDLVVVWL